LLECHAQKKTAAWGVRTQKREENVLKKKWRKRALLHAKTAWKKAKDFGAKAREDCPNCPKISGPRNMIPKGVALNIKRSHKKGGTE